jgi:hypothetical protein
MERAIAATRRPDEAAANLEHRQPGFGDVTPTFL